MKTYRRFVSIALLIFCCCAAHSIGKNDPRNSTIVKLEQMSAADLGEVLVKAQKGDADSQVLVGVEKDVGCKSEKNLAEAAEWFRKAAVQNNVLAQVFLADHYRFGRGVKKSTKDAIHWYKKAAEKGNAVAESHLGGIYFWGDGVNKDFNEAAEWYIKAVKQGNTDAEINLAWLYHLGQGVPKNESLSAQLYEDAARRGEPLGLVNLGEMYRDGDGLPQDYGRALDILKKAAELGSSTAQNDLGEMYRDGMGVPRDSQAALSYFLKAAEQRDDSRVLVNLCRYYQNTVPPDLVSAYVWCYVSAQDDSHQSDRALKDLFKKLSNNEITSATNRASEWLSAHPHGLEGCTAAH
jgi:TPR repeat protein